MKTGLEAETLTAACVSTSEAEHARITILLGRSNSEFLDVSLRTVVLLFSPDSESSAVDHDGPKQLQDVPMSGLNMPGMPGTASVTASSQRADPYLFRPRGSLSRGWFELQCLTGKFFALIMSRAHERKAESCAY